MGKLRVALVCAVAACGSVGGKADAPTGDVPSGGDACMGCIDNGKTCTASSQCTSGHCECSDATCMSKVCSAVTCACQMSTGTVCQGDIAAGYDDGTDSCGASTCDGTGACGTPLLWYKLDEAAGTGTVTNSGTWPGTATVAGTQGVAGQVGKALQLAQTTDGVNIADPADNSLDGFLDWTAEGWIDMSALPVDGYATLVKKNGAYICRVVEPIGTSGVYSLQGVVDVPTQIAANYTITPAPVTGTWYHLACVYSAGTLKVYWNGSFGISATGTNAATTNSQNALGIGHDPTNIENLVGTVDDVKMWTTARSDRQICLDACGSYSGTTCTFDGVCGN